MLGSPKIYPPPTLPTPLPPQTPINEKNFSTKFYVTADCNLAQDVTAISQETNWLGPVISKTVGKISHHIAIYYYGRASLFSVIKFNRENDDRFEA